MLGAILAIRLNSIHHLVGFAEHFRNGSRRPQESHDAYAERDRPRSFMHGLLQGLPNPSNNPLSSRSCRLRQKDCEFISSNPRDQVRGPQCIPDSHRGRSKDFVSGFVAEGVIQKLEIVEIDNTPD